MFQDCAALGISSTQIIHQLLLCKETCELRYMSLRCGGGLHPDYRELK